MMQKEIIGIGILFISCYAVGILWQQNRTICLKEKLVLMHEKIKILDETINQVQQEIVGCKTVSFLTMALAEHEFIPLASVHLVTCS